MQTNFNVPSPRPAESFSHTSRSNTSARSNPSTPATHARRPSIPISPVSNLPRPVPVPLRHGSSYGHSQRPCFGTIATDTPSPHLRRQARGSSSTGSSSLSGSILFGPASLPSSSFLGAAEVSVQRSRSDRRPSESRPEMHLRERVPENDGWLDITAEEILATRDDVQARLVSGAISTEEAVDILIKSQHTCLLVEKTNDPVSYGFFDYADLNTFLLLVLQASSQTPSTLKSSTSPVKPRYARADSFSSSECAIEEDEPTEFPYDRNREIIQLIKRKDKVKVGSVCDISQKDPFYVLPADAPLRSILPLFASGIHRIAITSLDSAPLILTDAMLLEHLISLPPDLIPTNFNLAVTSSTLNLPLHPLISLPGTASVLDAMQVMSAQGLSALGVLSGSGSGSNRSSSSSIGSTSGSGVSSKSPSEGHFSSSPLLMPTLSPGLDVTAPPLDNPTGSGELISVVTAQDCTTLVVPSEGKQVLGMGLQHMVKALQVIEHAGETRGEERMPGALPRYQLSSLMVPVHTVTFSTILLHACHLILATASSRVFMRTPLGVSPPLSPTPSLTMSAFSPPSSPSLSSLSLSDTKPISHHISPPGLPLPPPIQLSPHYVISILDILACLAKAYHTKLAPPSPQVDDSVIIFPSSDESPLLTTQTWDLDPAGMGKRRRASAAAAEHAAIESWRWIGDVSH